MKIKVVVLEPGKPARAEEIESSLEAMQELVGGYIEGMYPFEEEVCIVCNEEGKMNGIALNRAIYGESGEIVDIIAGPCFICDSSGENFGSLSDDQIGRYISMFQYPEKFFRVGSEICALKIME